MCQWFHFEDHRLDLAVQWLRRLGVQQLRTGISWADWHRPECRAPGSTGRWHALREFDVTLTLCFTPPSRGRREHYTSPPLVPEEFALFAREVIGRYAPARAEAALARTT